LKEVKRTDKLSGLKISGYISTPNYTRSSKKDYYLYVNSRIVKCPVFQKAIDMAYRNLIGHSRYPFIVLNLEIPPSDVDVNVHPTKKEVRYKNPNQIFNFIYSAIDSTLKTSYKEHESTDSQLDKKDEPISFLAKKEEKEEREAIEDDIYVPANITIADIFKKPPEEKEEKSKNPNRANFQVVGENYTPVQAKIVSTPEFVQEDVIIGQYRKTYILIEKEDGLEIVDQHIADERYIYETIKKSKNIDCQLLFLSDVIEISPSDKSVLETSKPKLEKFGYEIDFISDNEVIFRKVPQILSKIPPKDILADILENISGNIDNIEENILITTSCKAAVKANTYLNQYQMEEIIRNWRKCENPETCPHGRPISKFISHKDIAKFFQRNM
jgi:DNA mismatch repair protein MutL